MVKDSSLTPISVLDLTKVLTHGVWFLLAQLLWTVYLQTRNQLKKRGNTDNAITPQNSHRQGHLNKTLEISVYLF